VFQVQLHDFLRFDSTVVINVLYIVPKVNNQFFFYFEA